jgi:hypothetical protein
MVDKPENLTVRQRRELLTSEQVAAIRARSQHPFALERLGVTPNLQNTLIGKDVPALCDSHDGLVREEMHVPPKSAKEPK